MKNKLNQYYIFSTDLEVKLHFFTQAKNHKDALKNLQKNSNDYKKLIIKNDKLIIEITKL